MRAIGPAALAALLSAAPYAGGFNLHPSTPSAVTKTRRPSSFRVGKGGLLPLYSTLDRTKDTSSASEDKVSDAFNAESSSKILGSPVPYSELTVGVLKETYPGENRVSVAPESVKALVDAGFSVVVESGGEFLQPHEIFRCVVVLVFTSWVH